MRPRGYISNRVATVTMALLFGCGIVFGIFLQKHRPNPNPTPALARTQVKFMSFPPLPKLKSETIVWIEPGWRVVGVTDSHLILSMGERPWEKE